VAPIVTVSIGVGTVIPGSADELIHFIEAVDKRLYRGKQEGRNTMVLSRPSSRPASV
jgi:PleD family two-component response regulator